MTKNIAERRIKYLWKKKKWYILSLIYCYMKTWFKFMKKKLMSEESNVYEKKESNAARAFELWVNK